MIDIAATDNDQETDIIETDTMTDGKDNDKDIIMIVTTGHEIDLLEGHMTEAGEQEMTEVVFMKIQIEDIEEDHLLKTAIREGEGHPTIQERENSIDHLKEKLSMAIIIDQSISNPALFTYL